MTWLPDMAAILSETPAIGLQFNVLDPHALDAACEAVADQKHHGFQFDE
ncbi:hypothetical protein ACFOHU_12575 [Ottowia pentelensis]|uniref:Uncharacterized protein n=1 Tax=Ottowia pentelensis TaxID=511108 RepID=A0ABV6PQ52_9BURK|nr:hypothetical protein [Pseudomonadota bacterium]